MSRLLTLFSLLTLITPIYADNTYCSLCQTVVEWQQQAVRDNSGSLDQIDQFIRNLCTSIPDPQQQHDCLTLISNVEYDTTWFINTPSLDVCNQLLNSTCQSINTYAQHSLDPNPTCVTCYAMGTVIGVTETMNISHSILPSIFQSICDMTQTIPCPLNHLDRMIDAIDAGMAIDQMCQKEQLCTVKIPKLVIDIRENINIQEKPNDAWCDMCQLIVSAEQLQLKQSESNLTEIDSAARKFCTMLSETKQQQQCLSFIEMLEKDVIWVIQTDAKTVCSTLGNGICTSEQKALMLMPQGDHPECIVCHIMGHVIAVTEQWNMSRDGLPTIFNSICQLTQLSPCPTDKLNDMLALIKSGRSIKEMCMDEQMCGSTKDMLGHMQVRPQENVLCQVCQVIVSTEQLVFKLASGVFQVADEIAHAICDLLPEPQKGQCFTFLAGLETNTQWFIEHTPSEICSSWFNNICNSQMATIDMSMDIQLYARPIPVSCIACEIMGSLITVTETWKLPRDNLPAIFTTICQLTKLSPCPVEKLNSMLLAIDMGFSVQDMCIHEKMCVPSIQHKGIAVIQPDDVAITTTTSTIVPLQSSITCELCQLIVTITQLFMKLFAGPIQILNEIIVSICNTLQHDSKRTCLNWITYIAREEEWILANSPETICTVWLPQTCAVKMTPLLELPANEDMTCTSCRLMSRMVHILPNMDTQQGYDLLSKITRVFRIDMQEMLDMIPIMLSMRTSPWSEERSMILCVQQHMCFGHALILPSTQSQASTSCSVCVGVTSTVQAAYRTSHPVYGFIHALTVEICTHLGGSIASSCMALMDEMTHDMTYMTTPPVQLCSDFLVQSCANAIPSQQLLLGQTDMSTSMITSDQLLQPQAISCVTCHLFTTLMSIISESNPGHGIESSVDQWIAILHSTCQQYDDHITCQALSDYIPIMMRWQERGFNTIQICQYVEACPAIPQ